MNKNLKKCPLIINYISPIESDLDIEPIYQEYKLVISVDPSSIYGFEQILPQKYIVRVPELNNIKLSLLPSQGKNKFRYRVQYYGDNKLLDEQYWLVPKTPDKQTLAIDIVNGEYSMPNNIYELLEISPEVEYTITNGILYISTDGVYTIIYQPALTLYDVVVTNE
jgi:hypothetical protein